MNPIRWFRKNNKKLMAGLVVLLMVAFIGGSYIRYLTKKRYFPVKVVATFANEQEIKNTDIQEAMQELNILRNIGADQLLRSINMPQYQVQDMQALMLGELLFTDKRVSSSINQNVKQIIMKSGYPVSDKQINDIYRPKFQPEIYWILLSNEAEKAGIVVTRDSVKKNLLALLPQLARASGRPEAGDYNLIISAIIEEYKVSEDQVLDIFGKLLGVLRYTRVVCSNESMSIPQLKETVSREMETMDAQIIRVNSKTFLDEQPIPSDTSISNHFEKYRSVFEGDFSEDNPFGFGYKLSDRVSMEYMVVKLDDIKNIIKIPTPEETEAFYQRNKSQFTQQIPVDPNDPNSPMTQQIRGYAELSGLIYRQLLQTKINSQAASILSDAKDITETAYDQMEKDTTQFDKSDFKNLAGDYSQAAKQLSDKFKISVYTGKTGLLSAKDIQADKFLSRLVLKGYGYNYVPLNQIVFSIDELATTDLSVFDVTKPKIFQNIGPFNDYNGRIMAVLRVVDYAKAAQPTQLDEMLTKDTLKIDDPDEQITDIYSIREQVVTDLKKVSAMTTCFQKSKEFASIANEKGWDQAIDQFNNDYPKQEGEPNAFSITMLPNITRISQKDIEIINIQSQSKPSADYLINRARVQKAFTERLYDLLPEDANYIDKPIIIPFKPEKSYYIVKALRLNEIDSSQYLKAKSQKAYREDFLFSQALAFDHFNPELIIRRMNFEFIKNEQQKTTDPNAAEDQVK